MSILYKHSLETVTRLNADLGTLTVGVPTDTAGTYALINQMISDLSSIKASLKVQEKVISAQCSTLAAIGEVTTENAMTAGSVIVATKYCTAGPGDSSSDRYDADTAANTLPAVLTNSTNKYSESAVFAVLASACEIIDKLKNGTWGAENIDLAVTATLAT
tara:strand:- start:130 stop:612 length:483 start_codon:yes stop_codon:yes gene_type:complete